MKNPRRFFRSEWAIVVIGIACIAMLNSTVAENSYLPADSDMSEKDSSYLEDGWYAFCYWSGSGNTFMDKINILKVQIEPNQIVNSSELIQEEPFQVFYITRHNNEYYSIVSIASWEYLAASDNGELVLEKPFEGNAEQLWKFRYSKDKYYSIINLKGGYLFFDDFKGKFIAGPAEYDGWQLIKINHK